MFVASLWQICSHATNSFHSGQMCSAGSRLFVQAKIYDEFVKGLAGAAQAAKGGSGFDPSYTSGPVVSSTQFDVSGTVTPLVTWR